MDRMEQSLDDSRNRIASKLDGMRDIYTDMNDTTEQLHEGFDGLPKQLVRIDEKLDEILRRLNLAQGATSEMGKIT
jgi:archaellum component FlaC